MLQFRVRLESVVQFTKPVSYLSLFALWHIYHSFLFYFTEFVARVRKKSKHWKGELGNKYIYNFDQSFLVIVHVYVLSDLYDIFSTYSYEIKSC